MEWLVVIIIVGIVLIGIFRTGGAWFTSPCPHCRQRIGNNASVCPWCGRDVKPGWK